MFWGGRGRRIAGLLAVGLALALPAAGHAVDDESKEDASWNSIIETDDAESSAEAAERQARLVSWNSGSEASEPAP